MDEERDADLHPDPTDWGTWESLIEGGLRNESWKEGRREVGA